MDTTIIKRGIFRAIHWAAAALVLANLIFTEDDGTAHIYVGYTVFGLILLRLAWGIATPNHNRHEIGHNPFGTAMKLAQWSLWGCILVLGITGYLMETPNFWNSEWLEEIHEGATGVLWALIPLHIAAAVLMSKRKPFSLSRGIADSETVRD